MSDIVYLYRLWHLHKSLSTCTVTLDSASMNRNGNLSVVCTGVVAMVDGINDIVMVILHDSIDK